MPDTVFLSSEEVWQRGHGPEHPLKPERLRRTHELLAEYGLLNKPNVQVVPPRPASEAELRLFHKPEYVDAVHALSQGDLTFPAWKFGFGPGDNPVFRGMHHSEGLKVGSAVQAAKMLVNNRCEVAFSYSGGLHHGAPMRASGFCVYNDAAVAIHWLLDKGLRVAYIDIDVHHGDGVQDAFYDSDQVLTISLHQDGQTLFPGTGFISETGSGIGTGYSVNIPLPPGTGDEHYLQAFDQLVPALIDRFQPDILVTQLGVDTHRLDPLANLELTTTGHLSLYRSISELSSLWLALGGGGYDIGVVPRSWTLAVGVMTGIDLPDKLPAGYAARYGDLNLSDQEPGQLEPALQQRIEIKIESIINRVKKFHDL